MAIHIDPLNIPPRYYKPLGQLVAGWNLTEALISSTIWHLYKIKDPQIGRLLTYRLNSIDKLHIVSRSQQITPDAKHIRAWSMGTHAERVQDVEDVLSE